MYILSAAVITERCYHSFSASNYTEAIHARCSFLGKRREMGEGKAEGAGENGEMKKDMIGCNIFFLKM